MWPEWDNTVLRLSGASAASPSARDLSRAPKTPAPPPSAPKQQRRWSTFPVIDTQTADRGSYETRTLHRHVLQTSFLTTYVWEGGRGFQPTLAAPNERVGRRLGHPQTPPSCAFLSSLPPVRPSSRRRLFAKTRSWLYS